MLTWLPQREPGCGDVKKPSRGPQGELLGRVRLIHKRPASFEIMRFAAYERRNNGDNRRIRAAKDSDRQAASTERAALDCASSFQSLCQRNPAAELLCHHRLFDRRTFTTTRCRVRSIADITRKTPPKSPEATPPPRMAQRLQ